MRLIRNAIQTPDGTMLISRHRHDYRTHEDANGKMYMVDGGLDYSRRSAHGDEVDKCLYDTEPHRVQREILRWGSYGKAGDEPLTYKPVSEMDTEHLQVVLRDCRTSPVIGACMRKELEYRDA